LSNERKITDEEGREFAEKFFADYHFTVSAKTDEGIEDMMNQLAKDINLKFGPELRKKLARRSSVRLT